MLPIRFHRVVAAICFFAAAPLLAQAPAEKKTPPTSFLRIQQNADKQPVALETAIIRYVPASGQGNLTVDLVSVVHVGEKAYYEKLNKQFEQYDVLLYELVAPAGTVIPKGGKKNNDHPVAILQQMMKLVLGLEHQTDLIDYTKKNFVHADMSPADMAEAIKKRGDNALTLTLGVMADVMRQQNMALLKGGNAGADFDPLSLLTDGDAGLKLKRMMAQQLASMEGAGLGQTINTILITDRNGAAMKVFQKEMANGKKKIAIFYGAAHMPDFEKRLRDDFGLKRDSVTWLKAWDLQTQPKLGVDDLLKMLK